MKYLVGALGMIGGGVIVASGQPVIGAALLLVTVAVMALWPSAK